jgi:hypothetical protein
MLPAQPAVGSTRPGTSCRNEPRAGAPTLDQISFAHHVHRPGKRQALQLTQTHQIDCYLPCMAMHAHVPCVCSWAHPCTALS